MSHRNQQHFLFFLFRSRKVAMKKKKTIANGNLYLDCSCCASFCSRQLSVVIVPRAIFRRCVKRLGTTSLLAVWEVLAPSPQGPVAPVCVPRCPPNPAATELAVSTSLESEFEGVPEGPEPNKNISIGTETTLELSSVSFSDEETEARCG